MLATHNHCNTCKLSSTKKKGKRNPLLRFRIGRLGKDLLHPFSFFFGVWKKAYMPIDANHISNSKDR